MSRIDNLLPAAAVIRDASEQGENTALRVGSLFVDLIQELSQLLSSGGTDVSSISINIGSSDITLHFEGVDSEGTAIERNLTLPAATPYKAGVVTPELYNNILNVISSCQSLNQRIVVLSSTVNELSSRLEVFNSDDPNEKHVIPTTNQAICTSDDGKFWYWCAADQMWYLAQRDNSDGIYDISWIKNYTTNSTLTSTQSEELNYLISAHSGYYTNVQYERSLAWVWADDTYFHVVNAFGEHWIVDGHVQGAFVVVSKETNFWNSLYANIATTNNLTTAISGQLKRNLYTSFGATYNTTSKRYELNGLTDITEAEMDVIFKLTHDFRLCGSLRARFILQTNAGFRTNLFPYANPVFFSAQGDERFNIDCYQMCYNCNRLETFRVSADLTASVPTRGLQVSNCTYMFYNCPRLKTILGVINIQNCTSAGWMFGGCSALQSVNIAGLKCNIDLSACTQITKASVLFMIENSTVTASAQATITLAASVYDTLIEDTDINNAIAAKDGNIFLASA